jgi:hypothetical protein
VVPANIKPIWAEDTFLVLLAENNLIEKTPAPETLNKLSSSIVKDFIIFRHPVTGEMVRLPWNYSEVVLTIDGKNYALPKHPKSEEQTAVINKFIDSESNDLWS